jgi:excisionase family DNA binding protein
VRGDEGAGSATPIAQTCLGRLLTAPELAARLGVSTGWIYAAVRLKRIPHVPLGRNVRFREETIEAWLREQERGGGL